jgi:hypothetical protein
MCDQLGRPENGAVSCKKLGGVTTAVASSDQVSIRNLKRLARAGFILAAIGVMSAQPAFSGNTPKPLIPVQTSTTPSNGDVNPYGVAFVPAGFPTTSTVAPGDVLVSNFNDSSNVQGTGTTIVSISPDGTQNLFFQGTPPLGLTTALNVLKKGFVIVGNVPNKKGTAEQGSLIVLDKDGNQLTALVDSTFLDGPWDSAVIDNGESAIVFVSCVLNGTVTRLELTFTGGAVAITSKVTIASGYLFGPNEAAFVVGPTGLAYDANEDLLYVASTADNQIFVVPDATKAKKSNGTGTGIISATNSSTYLHGPLGLVLAPNGDLITSQGDAINENLSELSEIVEFTAKGAFVTQFSIDSAVGAAFGIAINPSDNGTQFAAVDDQLDVVTVYDFSGN